jgi:tetratricopeptide (TPR) repeat protein
VSGEVVSPLEPLETADAVSLLDDRARSAGMRTWLPHEAATDLADALDGLPLAIELAAARLGELGLDGVRAGLSDRLELLRHGPRAHARHRTIERAVEWSWRLLEEAEQVTLRRLSVFAGTFGEDAVVAVAGPQTGRHLDRLVATSLVSPAPAAPDGTPRWRLLDTVRAYVTSKLAAAGEQATIDERHQAWIHGLVRELERRRLTGDDQPLTISIAESEHDNIAAAIYRGGSTALEITDSVWGLWCARGRRREWTSAVRQALERAPDAPPEVRAGAKHKLADELVRSGRLEEAKALLEEAFALLGDNAPDRLVGGIHNALAHIAMRSGEIDSAGELLERGLDRLGGVHAEGAASLAGNLGNIRHFQGRLEEARTIFADVIAAARARGDHERVIVQLLNLGALETRAERIAEGERHTLDALREMIETGIHLQLQGALVNLAMLWLAAAPDLGARTWGAALAHMERTGFVIGDTERAEVERDLQRARELLGPETFENLVAEGSQWTIERVLASGPQLG